MVPERDGVKEVIVIPDYQGKDGNVRSYNFL